MSLEFQGLTIEPAFQEIVLAADQEATSAAVLITNTNSTPIDLELFAYDFKHADTYGTLAFLETIDPGYPHSLASFVGLAIDQVVLKSGETKRIDVTITNRDSLQPGGHYGALIARLRGQVVQDQQVVMPALSSLFLVRKEGAVTFHLSLDELYWKNVATIRVPQTIRFMLGNQGNTHLVPRGTIEVKDLFNRVISQGLINENSSYILPGTQRVYTTTLQQSRTPLPISLMKLEVQGYSTIGEVKFISSLTFLYVSWWFLVGVVTLCVASIAGFVLYRKRNKHD